MHDARPHPKGSQKLTACSQDVAGLPLSTIVRVHACACDAVTGVVGAGFAVVTCDGGVDALVVAAARLFEAGPWRARTAVQGVATPIIGCAALSADVLTLVLGGWVIDGAYKKADMHHMAGYQGRGYSKLACYIYSA